MKTCIFALAIFLITTHVGMAQEISKEVQIKLAVAAAPAELRDEASVYGYDKDGKLGMIKQGKNDLICLADDPQQKGLNVSCYHKDLEPFMMRGRELKASGKGFQEIFDLREKEVKDGKLKMPEDPSSLYVFTAQEDAYDKTTGEITKGYLRYVIYIPYATAESTGLPLTPSAPGMPWIMDPGTHRAHIMINPPKD